MARICALFPVTVNRGVLWAGAWIPGYVELGTVDTQVGPSGETDFLCGPGTIRPIGFTLEELVRSAFTIKSWQLTYNAQRTTTIISPPSSSTSSASGAYTAPHLSGAGDFQPDFLIYNSFVGSDISNGKGCSMDVSFHNLASVSGAGGAVLFYPGMQALIATPSLFNTVKQAQSDVSVGNFTLAVGSGTKTCPIYNSRLNDPNLTESSSGSITVNADKYWPYKDSAGVALYNETTGDPLIE